MSILISNGADSPRIHSAADLITSGPATGYSVTSSDYPNATNKELDFLNQFTATCKSFVKVSFERQIGWMLKAALGTSIFLNQLKLSSNKSFHTLIHGQNHPPTRDRKSQP